ncbi:MAG: response regulator transcription factor [Actinobacteria bacterium]|nr:response regulator transcription factor [Actinomycetota bacterium]
MPAEPTRPVRVLIVDDHAIFVEGLTAVLDRDERFDVVGTAGSGRDAVRLAAETGAEVVLMDMSMPVLDGVAATRRLLDAQPDVRVIALSGHTDRLSRKAALEAGAAEFVSKSENLELLASTIMAVCGRREPATG